MTTFIIISAIANKNKMKKYFKNKQQKKNCRYHKLSDNDENNYNLKKAKERIYLYLKSFKKDGTRITENLDFITTL